jgi:pyruvate dehydrogenase (quinone)
VTSDDEVEAAWETAFSHPGITLIDAYTSKNIPPLPPHVTRKLVINTAKALLKEGPAAAGPLRDSAEAVLSEGLERVKSALHIGDDAGR